MADEENVNASRFSVSVPDPSCRLNMGKPETSDSSFGVPGISLKSSKFFLMDVTKDALVQTGAAYLQTGGAWDQFASGNMTLATKGDGKMAASGNVLVAAGPGQGQMKSLTYEQVAPKWVDYNNLSLHYLVDGLANNLKKLLYGTDWKKHQETKKAAQGGWWESGYPDLGDSALLSQFAEHLDELGYDCASQPGAVKSLLKPLEWSGDHHACAATHWPPWKKTSEFGALKNFDPYAPSSLNNWLSYPLAIVGQATVFLKRLSDVVQSILPTLGGNELSFRLKKLVGATKAVNSAILAFNPKKWERYGGDAWTGAYDRFDKTHDAFTDAGDTKAKLVSGAAPFDISGVDDLVLEVLDEPDGTAQPVSFALTAAELSLTVNDKLTRIRVARQSKDAELTLDGATVTWNQGTQAWQGVPGGFNVSGGRFDKGGGAFSAVAVKDVTIADESFESGALYLDVDGTAHDKPIGSLASLDAEERAQKLAALVRGTGGCQIDRSGTTLTIKSAKRGSDSKIEVAGDGFLALFGITGSATGSGDAEIDAGELKAKLESIGGDYQVSVDGGKVEVKHNQDGSASYLQMKGPLAATFFGENPAEATGKDFWDRGGDAYLIEARMDAWFGLGPLHDLARPVYEALDQAIAVWSQLEKALKELAAFIKPKTGSNPGIGLLSGGGGITLGTSGQIFGTAHSVQLIAAGNKGEKPDMDKYIVGLEHIIYGVKELDKLANEIVKYLWGETPPTEEEKRSAATGHLRMVSDGTTHVLSRGATRVLCNDEITMLGKSFDAIVGGGVTVASREAGVSVLGKTITLGQQGYYKPQSETEAITASSSGVIQLLAKETGVWVEDTDSASRIAFGKHGEARTTLLEDELHAVIDLKQKQIFAGKGADGLTIDKDGNVTAKCPTGVEIFAGGTKTLEVKSGNVTISGKLDVGGGALTVNGVAMPSPPEIKLCIDTTAALVAALKAKHETVLAAAKALQKSLQVTDKTIEKASETIANLPVTDPLTTAKTVKQAKKALATAWKLRDHMQTRLRALRATWDGIVAEAQKLQVEEILSKVEENKGLFRSWFL